MTAEQRRDDEQEDAGEETRAAPVPIPRPSSRELEHGVQGIEVESRGQTWKLARLGLARSMTEVRDRLNDDRTIYSDVGIRDIRHAAWVMLSANYRLESEEIIAIIEGAGKMELANAVVQGLFVDEYEEAEMTYSNWARSALIANGIDPARIQVQDIPHVLRQLVATGRAIPLQEFTASAAFNALRAEIMRAD